MYGDIGKAILELRATGLSYDKIRKKLGCSKSTICYHCGNGQKEMNAKRRKKRRKISHPYVSKKETFTKRYYKEKEIKPLKNTPKKLLYHKFHLFIGESIMNATFTLEELIDKLGDNPKCYLTGEPIDINKPSTYQFDHIIPASRGGTNDLDNLGITTKEVNQAKRNMTPDEFVNLCKKVLEHQGYKVGKNK